MGITVKHPAFQNKKQPECHYCLYQVKVNNTYKSHLHFRLGKKLKLPRYRNRAKCTLQQAQFGNTSQLPCDLAIN